MRGTAPHMVLHYTHGTALHAWFCSTCVILLYTIRLQALLCRSPLSCQPPDSSIALILESVHTLHGADVGEEGCLTAESAASLAAPLLACCMENTVYRFQDVAQLVAHVTRQASNDVHSDKSWPCS